ncbi:hypothetical protein C7457_0576 [Thermovibrio guaymasensis]|uniref:Uncharacterized protein n=1 Tax=Thermovibrio guaymasensis TaxID=240167 RepID=A0A420W8Q5_9BACT|nr:hypothetical protein [Thermovibrio guaymasensis]RKQ63696.1 hypothetical protein C7457_0576 [Thermovibrio guaymasensis]
MVRVTLLLLILIPCIAYAGKEEVCIYNSYNVPPALKLKKKLEEILEEKGYDVSYMADNCDVKLVIGTPALIRVLKKEDFKKLIYTFVLFPEELHIIRENVYGIRIFPLPERSVRVFMKEKGLNNIEVAVPISRKMLPIAKKYLPKKYFKIFVFKKSPSEVFGKLIKYKYVYIFPDPKILKVVNLVNLISFGKENGILFLTGLKDLKNYDVDFVHGVSYEKLANEMVELIDKEPKEKILPCPVEE